ncbi:hypothetical protein PT974_12383 [Cladobotryum mycophilum]|uniref:BZIP transcription factor n=1 Tax=Cladobotryum mycophilum TaxID=491253 RepID=A0ABR0S7T0_9HYPO
METNNRFSTRPTQAQSGAPADSGAGSGAGTGASGTVNQERQDKLAARKLKKRELDRKAQRVARERTKSRIAHLEALVEHFQANNPNSEVSQLSTALSQVTEHRDSLLGVLRSIECQIRRHVPVQGTPLIRQPQYSSSSPESEPMSSSMAETFISTSTDSKSGPSFSTPSQSQLESSYERTPCMHHPHNSSQSEQWESLTVLDVGPTPRSINQFTEPSSFGPPLPPEWPRPLQSDAVDDVIVPSPPAPCDCMVTDTDPNSNTWRSANSALGKSTKLNMRQLLIEDFTSQDTPIRVILEGWDSVEKSGKMSLSWRKLRLIDETCFSTCGRTERLAILRMMHLLITYHGDPTPERKSLLPRWFWSRPSQQAVPHSYAIDFFVWPGLRERFIFGQHRYCTNLFWTLFRDTIQVMWPHNFEDCYTTDYETGRFVMTDHFENRIRELQTWRMRQDFFNQFPELTDDMPVSNGLPMAMSSANRGFMFQRPRYAKVEEIYDDQTTEAPDGNEPASTLPINEMPPPSYCDANNLANTNLPFEMPVGWEEVVLQGNPSWPTL